MQILKSPRPDFQPNMIDIGGFFKKYKKDGISDYNDMSRWNIHTTIFDNGVCCIMKDVKCIKENVGIYPYLFNSRE